MPRRLPRLDKVYHCLRGGVRELWCPDCRTMIVASPETVGGLAAWKVTCKRCGAVYYAGTVLYRAPLGQGPDVIPPDMLVPAFAEVSPVRARKREPVNRLRQLRPDGSWEEL